MNINYNTEILEIKNFDDLDDYIVFDDNNPLFTLYFKKFKKLKVWKDGRITTIRDKNLDFITVKWLKEDSIRWKYGKEEYQSIEVRRIIWEVFSEKYNVVKTIRIGDNNKDFDFKDNNYTNLRIDNIIKYKKTNIGTEIWNNNNYYFDFDLKIINDIEEYLDVQEPVILDELPFFEIYRNGNIIDKRGLSKIIKDKNGYESISYNNKNYRVHRLVAKSYLRNTNNYNIVNHLDRDRSNNNVNNLEWVNNSINTLHGQITNILSYKASLDNDSLDNLYSNRSKYSTISLTSKNYREFIKSRILLELDMEVELWLFSNKTPLFLIFLPLYKKLGQDNIEKLGFYDHNFVNFMKKIMDSVYKNENRLCGLNIDRDEDLWLIIESLNKYMIPKSKDDHLLNILKILKIDFDNYFNWIFENIKIIFNDEVGFIFYEEFRKYINLMRMSEGGVYLNNIILYTKRYEDDLNIRDETSRNIEHYENTYHKLIYYNQNYFRICERIEYIHRFEIKNVNIDYERNYIYLLLNFWTFWKRKIR
jgi:hypothetical protein